MEISLKGAGDTAGPLFMTGCAYPEEQIRENMRSAIARGLKPLKLCDAHGGYLSIAAGGPSIADTYKEIKGHVATMNGSHDWLLSKGVVPYACGLLDPHPDLFRMITPRDDVVYFVASRCDPSLFDHLAGKHVFIWHASGQFDGEESLVKSVHRDWLMVGGGSTMALRWIPLGYVLGFRKFGLHGFDSSTRGRLHHAYDQDDGQCETLRIEGAATRPQWLAQITDFYAMLDTFASPGLDPVAFDVFGDGLFQKCWQEHKAGRFRPRMGMTNGRA